MPIKALCPECQTQYSVPETAAGKKVKCRNCEFVFPVPGEKVKPSAKPAAKDPWETADSDDEIPLLKPARKKKSNDGLPPKIVKKKTSTFIASDDDDEDDDPKPRKKKRKKRSYEETDPRLVFLAVALGVVVLAGVAGFFEPRVTLWAGVIAIAGGGLWQLMMAFEEDDFTGWLHMRVPGYSLYFAITRISETWPAVVVQALGLVLCIAYVPLEHRGAIGNFGRVFNIAAGGEDPEDAEDPEDVPFLKAAEPFANALAARNYEAAFAELSPLARANAFRDQFVPAGENAAQRASVAPLTLESFKELMTESEKVLGSPSHLEDLYLESRDPEVLAGRGDAIERMFVLGGTPEAIPAAVRRASLHAHVLVKHPEIPADEEDEDGPYLNMRIIVTEEEGKLGVGYFELSPPSILD